MRDLALASIGLYQRYLSPYKGFCCAYRMHTGAASCSQLALRAIRRWGVWSGLGVLRWRLAECAAVFKARHAAPNPRFGQRGSCDAPCDIPCDGSNVADACDACNCGCDGCDWSRHDTRPKRKEPEAR